MCDNLNILMIRILSKLNKKLISKQSRKIIKKFKLINQDNFQLNLDNNLK